MQVIFYLALLVGTAVTAPILIVPGIGQSVLCSNDKTIWPTASPNELLCYDCDIKASFNTTYLQGIITYFQSKGYLFGVDLLVFPYDWRQALNNVTILTEFHLIIERTRPTVIAHSMGGLLVEEYIRVYPFNKIRTFIAVGVPFKGAPVASLAILQGDNLGNPLLTDLELARRIIQSTYSIYWLLPQPSLGPIPIIYGKNWTSVINTTRYTIRAPVKLTMPTYYIAVNTQPTIYDYPSAVTVPGDDTVPVVSALHSRYHGVPETSEIVMKINTTHSLMLENKEILDELYRLVGWSNLNIFLVFLGVMCGLLVVFISAALIMHYIKTRKYTEID